MLSINDVTEEYENLPYMSHAQAVWLRNTILDNKYSSVCELGFYHGKSTAYIGAILKEQGFGKIHTFDRVANSVKPNVETVLGKFDLLDLVTITRAEKCFLWELGKLVEQHDDPIYDLCYFDGGHDYTTTALSFALLDKLTAPGGMLIFDDVSWRASEAPYDYTTIYPRMSREESVIPAVNFVCDSIVLKSGYREIPIQLYDWRVFVKQ
jgi:predicted O-methyltransferase YrrM